MTLRLFVLPFALLLLLGAAIAACGGDDDDGDDSGPDVTEPAGGNGDDGDNGDDIDDGDNGDNGGGGNGGGLFDSGSATLTIGDETWEFDGVFCAFSPEESRSDRVSFTMSAFGEAENGNRTQLDATIQDPDEEGRYEGEGVIHSVSLNDIDDFENPAVGWSALSGFLGTGEPFIEIDGDTVRAEATFDNELTDLEVEQVPGTLEASCS